MEQSRPALSLGNSYPPPLASRSFTINMQAGGRAPVISAFRPICVTQRRVPTLDRDTNRVSGNSATLPARVLFLEFSAVFGKYSNPLDTRALFSALVLVCSPVLLFVSQRCILIVSSRRSGMKECLIWIGSPNGWIMGTMYYKRRESQEPMLSDSKACVSRHEVY